MKTAAEYIETVYGTRTFDRAADVNDASSLMDLMQDFSYSNVKELFEMLIKVNNFILANKDKNYMVELLNRDVPELNNLIKQSTT